MALNRLAGGGRPEALRGNDSRMVSRYTLAGVLLGLIFPLGATLGDVWLNGLPLTLSNVVQAQASQPLHWIIDLAPLGLGLAGWQAGLRQQKLEHLSADMRQQSARQAKALESNAARLQTVAGVGNFMASARDLESMLVEVVEQIVKGFDIHHAQVFLLGETEKVAHLRASTGPVGREMMARNHRMEVGASTLVGQVLSSGEAVRVLRTDTDPVLRRNEMVPAARVELVLPLKVGDRTLGVLDVQAEDPNGLTLEDMPAYQAMADQLAVTVDNLHLLETARNSLRDIEALNRQLTGEAWRDFVAGRDPDAPLGYRADERGVHAVDGTHDETPGATKLPIVVRGQTIGELDVAVEDGEELDEDVQATLAAVAERIALALDNTRLSQEVQQTARIQHMVDELSDKLQHTTDMGDTVRLVATEVSRIMNTKRGFVRLEAQVDDGKSG